MNDTSNVLLFSLYYAEVCNEFAGSISASLHPGNSAPVEEMSQWWRAVVNTVSDLAGPRFKPQTSALEANALPFDHLTDTGD